MKVDMTFSVFRDGTETVRAVFEDGGDYTVAINPPFPTALTPKERKGVLIRALCDELVARI